MKRIALALILASAGVSAQQTQDADHQAQLAARQAELARMRALQEQLTKLRETHAESYPEIVDLEARLEKFRQREAKLETLAPAILGGNWARYGSQRGLPDKWWNNPTFVAQAGLTKDQQRKMDDVFFQYRLKLIDLNAALEKEEVALEPLVAADALDESKIAAQIDLVAQARAELEKANGRMLLGIRMVLTPEQWRKMQK